MYLNLLGVSAKSELFNHLGYTMKDVHSTIYQKNVIIVSDPLNSIKCDKSVELSFE